MRSITCVKCGQAFEIGFPANLIMICPQCKGIRIECEYGFGPIVPCEIYAGSKEIAKINYADPRGLRYRIDSDELGIHMELQKGYANLEVYEEASAIVIQAIDS